MPAPSHHISRAYAMTSPLLPIPTPSHHLSPYLHHPSLPHTYTITSPPSHTYTITSPLLPIPTPSPPPYLHHHITSPPHTYTITSPLLPIPTPSHHLSSPYLHHHITSPPHAYTITSPLLPIQVLFHLGAVHFRSTDYTKAYSLFSKSKQLMQSLSSTPPLLDKAKLNGYLLACLGMLPSEEGEHQLEKNSIAQKIERLRLRPSEFEVNQVMLATPH